MYQFKFFSVGIFFFAQPTFIFGSAAETEFSTMGLFFACLSAILAASCFNIIRKIGKNVHFTVTVMYYSLLGTIITGAIVSGSQKLIFYKEVNGHELK